MSLFVEQLVNGIVLGSVFATFAFGFGLVIASLGVFNVAHEAVFTAGAIAAYLFVQFAGPMPLWLLVLVSAAVAAVVNSFVYLLLVRPLEGRKNREMATFLSCIGGMFVLTEISRLILDNREVRFPASMGSGRIDIFGLELSSRQIVMVLTSLAAFALVFVVIERTHLGRAIRATSSDPEATTLQGISPSVIALVVFALSGALAGVAASVIGAAYNVVDAEMGGSYFLIAMAVMVLGGFGNTLGTLVAGLIIGCVSTLSTGFLTSGYRDVIVFGALLLILSVRAEGLLPTRSTRVRA
ncbi:branched-chain amino acid ABC transporter permease [Rhodococcus opacus]